MSSDFAAELDAALNAHLEALRAAAEQARRRIDESAPRPTPSPVRFNGTPPSAAAVSFDRDEEEPPQIEGLSDDLAFEAPVDSEGIPFPEEN